MALDLLVNGLDQKIMKSYPIRFHSRYYFSMGRMQYRTYLPLWKKGEETVKAPMYYSDLGQGIVNSITNPNAKGNIYEAYG